jgi:hypothetical protein
VLVGLQLNRYRRGMQHKQPAHTTLTTRPTTNPHNQTLTTSPHNSPIMASSPSISGWECGACASINKGGIYCPMCATPCPKRKKVLGAIAGDIAVHAALADAMSGIPSVVGALPPAQAKKDWAKIAGTPKPVANAVAALPAAVGKKAGTVDGAPMPVAKASKECSPATADIAAPAKVVSAPAPVTKVPGPFHPTGVVVEIVGAEVGDRGHSCEEHPNNCGKVLAKDVVVRLWKVQIQVEGWEETAIAAYWVTDGVDR